VLAGAAITLDQEIVEQLLELALVAGARTAQRERAQPVNPAPAGVRHAAETPAMPAWRHSFRHTLCQVTAFLE
jgi:hypothetical protein